MLQSDAGRISVCDNSRNGKRPLKIEGNKYESRQLRRLSLSFFPLFILVLLVAVVVIVFVMLFVALFGFCFFMFVGVSFFFLYTPVILAAGAIMEIISHVFGGAPPFPMALDELHSAAAQATASAPSTSSSQGSRSRMTTWTSELTMVIETRTVSGSQQTRLS